MRERLDKVDKKLPPAWQFIVPVLAKTGQV